MKNSTRTKRPYRVNLPLTPEMKNDIDFNRKMFYDNMNRTEYIRMAIRERLERDAKEKLKF